jgi:hypothetical protein
MARRNQRSETGTEIRDGINMDDALMCTTLFMGYLQCFEDKEGGFCYLHDASIGDSYQPASFQMPYNPSEDLISKKRNLNSKVGFLYIHSLASVL